LSSITKSKDHIIEVPNSAIGQRLDKFLATCKDLNLSRSRIKKLIELGNVELLSKRPISASLKLKAGDKIIVRIPPNKSLDIKPIKLPLDILYEDENLIVLNKPAGLVVHPGAGNEDKTLVHALIAHCRDLSGIGGVLRPGIVHRLDKDTSGVLLIAKNDITHQRLSQDFKASKIDKYYIALVRGRMRDISGRIDLPIGRHPIDRKKMYAPCEGGREAVSIWTLKESFEKASLVEVKILTGRTHQIRVHMAAISHPVLGDKVYGKQLDLVIKKTRVTFPRQMLHAARIRFLHPIKKEFLEITAPIPQDMSEKISILRSLSSGDL